jgi:hypothetical protein
MKQSTKSEDGERQQRRPWEDEATRLQRQTNDLIRQRPLLALTMAVVGGYVAGRVLSRV